MDYYERPHRDIYAFDDFIVALKKAAEKNSTPPGVKRNIKKICRIDYKASLTKSDKKKVASLSQDFIKYLKKIENSTAFYEAYREADDYRVTESHETRIRLTTIGSKIDNLEASYIARHKREEKKEVKITESKPSQVEREPVSRKTPSYPSANISYSEARAIAETKEMVEYFLDNLNTRQALRHVRNIRSILGKTYDEDQLRTVRHKVRKQLKEIQKKDPNNKLVVLIGKINKIYSEYITEEDFVGRMEYKIMEKIRTKTKQETQEEPTRTETPPTTYYQPQPATTKVAETMNVSDYQEMLREKKKYDEQYDKGKFEPFKEHHFDYRSDERKIAMIINHYYNPKYDEKFNKHNIEYFGVQALFELAQELADDIYESTILSATYNSSLYASKITNAYNIYSLKERMDKFEKFRKRFDDALDKLDESQKKAVLAEINKELWRSNLEPTKEGIIENVARREQKFIQENTAEEMYKSVRGEERRYSFKIAVTHIPLDQLAAAYLSAKKTLTDDRFYINEARIKEQEARENGRAAKADEYKTAADDIDQKREERRKQALTYLQQEFSEIILSRILPLNIKTHEKNAQLQADICRKYLKEEPLFFNSFGTEKDINETEAKRRYDEQEKLWQSKSGFSKFIQTISGKKPNINQIIRDIEKEDTEITKFSI